MIARAFSPLLRFLPWFFSPRAAGLDLVLAFPALGWAFLLATHPDMFQQGNWANISLVSRDIWLAIVGFLGCMHLVCIVRPHRELRIVTAAGSAWCWLFIAYALGRNGVTPGTLIHAELGLIALLGGLHLYSLPEGR